MKLNVFKVRETAKLPVRSHPTDAGMDLFYCPNDTTEKVELFPGDSVLLETGLKIEVPPGFMLQIMNKSGIATKRQLVTGACVVDSGYDGEIFVNLQNIGLSIEELLAGQKIAQAVLLPIMVPHLEEIAEDNVYGRRTSRSDGGFGSTGDR